MASARPAPPRPACLLVVADHPDIRAMVREALTEEGYRVCWPRSPSTREGAYSRAAWAKDAGRTDFSASTGVRS